MFKMLFKLSEGISDDLSPIVTFASLRELKPHNGQFVGQLELLNYLVRHQEQVKPCLLW